jgi:hypothetical protein
MAKSVDEALASMDQNLLAKTGRTIAQWVAIANAPGLQKHGEIVKFLKAEHDLTHGYANRVAQLALAAAGGGQAGAEDLVAGQYSGARAALKPIHDAIVAAVKKFGGDVEIAPKKTGVSLRRSKQFALIQPASNTRVDLGLQLKGVPLGGRLEKWPNTMCTHRVRLESKAAVDAGLIALLKQAYSKA